MSIIYIVLRIVAASLTVYFAIKSREFRKFLSGAFLQVVEFNSIYSLLKFLCHSQTPALFKNA